MASSSDIRQQQLPTTRQRKLKGPKFKGTTRQTVVLTGVVRPPITTVLDAAGTQKTVSESHHRPPFKGGFDEGGAFYTSKTFVASPVTPNYATVAKVIGSVAHSYSGVVVAGYPRDAKGAPLFPDTSASSNAALDALGAEAIAACKPAESPADLSTFLAELMREGLPSLVGSGTWKNRTDSARKNIANEHLNFQFGLLPVISEVRSLANAIRHADKILAQYERDAGRIVRRRFEFPIVRSTSESSTSLLSPLNAGSHPVLREYLPAGSSIMSESITHRRWFSGAFTYHLPSDYDSRNKLRELSSKAEFLLGTKLTPEVLWNISPWSWAADWFSNTGDVVSNLQAFKSQGLIMRYGYMMEHTIAERTYSHSGTRNSGAPVVADVVLITETKQRRQANPFGFGLTWGALSPLQLSIAAALGLSQGRR